MPDYNPAVALDLKPPENSLAQTFNTIANLQQTQAHTGLYQLQAQQQQRDLDAKRAYADTIRGGGSLHDAAMAAVSRGGNTNDVNQLLAASSLENELKVGGGLRASAQQEFSGANLNRARTAEAQLQAQQQQRDLNSKRAYANAISSGQTPAQAIHAFVINGGNPADLNQLQTASEMQTEMQRGGGLSMASLERQTAATKNRAETSNLGVQHQIYQTDLAKKDMEFRGSTAQSLFADPSDENWKANVPNLRGHVSPQGQAQIDAAMKDPSLRPRVAQSMIAAAMPTAEATRPLSKEPGVGYQTPLERIAGGGGTQPVSVGAKKEQEQYGETLGKEPGTLAEKAEGARQQNFTLEQMKAESASWPMGKGAKPWMVAQQYMKPFANAFGSTAFDQPVADYESFEKNTGTLVRQAVKEVSSRAAVQEFNMIQKQLPSAEMSRQGFHQIATQFQSVNDYQIAKQQAAQTWRDTHGTMDKFDSDWNKNITPTAFLVGRMSPEQLHQVTAGLQKTAEGRATLASITRQIQYAQEQRLF